MKRIIIESSGRAFIRTYTDVDVRLTEAIMQSLNTGHRIILPHIHVLDSHGEKMDVSGEISSDGSALFVVNLHSIRFTSGITSRDGVVSLNFESPNKLEVLWKPHDDMTLVLVVNSYRDHRQWCCEKCYLMAYDTKGTAYRLPVANVFDDASLCTGDFSRVMPSIADLVKACYVQFRESPWNADLYSSKADEFKIRTEKMFRWRANDSGFEQLNSTEDWKSLCYQVGHDITERSYPVALNGSRGVGTQRTVDIDDLLDPDDDEDNDTDNEDGGDNER